MNIRETLLEEQSIAQRNKIVRFIGNDARRFDQLMELFFSPEYRVAQRAAWPMSYVVQEHPGLVKKHLPRMVKLLDTKEVHPAVRRNIVRALQEIDVPKSLHGRLMNTCFTLIGANETAAAIKAFSLTVLHNLSRRYPEIKAELKLLIEERMSHETAAFRSRANKILKNL